MGIQYINTGSSANAGNGDSIRTAFNKVNRNFAELYQIAGTAGASLTETITTVSTSLLVHDAHVNLTATWDPVDDRIVFTAAASPVGTGPTGPTGPLGPTGPQGETGPSGLNGTSFYWQGAYSPSTTYKTNDVVSHYGKSFISKIDSNSGFDPLVSPGEWELMVDAGQQGPTGPSGADGLLGPTGPTGPAGAFTGNAAQYKFGEFNKISTDAVGTGYFNFNNSNVTNSTEIYFNTLDINGADFYNWFSSIGSVDNPIKGYLHVSKLNDNSSFALYQVTATTNAIFFVLGVSYITGNGSFALSDDVVVSFASAGARGISYDLNALNTSIIPVTANNYDLGSQTFPWRSLYVGTSTIYIGGKALSIDSSDNLTINGVVAGIQGPPGPTGPSPFDGVITQGTTSTVGELAFYKTSSTITFIPTISYNTASKYLTIGGGGTNNFTGLSIRTSEFTLNETMRFMQYHSGADSVNSPVWYKFRGTESNPEAVIAGDEIAELVFKGYDGTTSTTGAYMTAIVEHSTASSIPMSLRFGAITSGTFLSTLLISSSGTIRLNKLSNLVTSDRISVSSNLVPDGSRTLGLSTLTWNTVFASTASVSSVSFADGTTQTTAYLVGSAPLNSTSTGVAGTLAYDASYMYVCTATNSWQRIAWDNTPW